MNALAFVVASHCDAESLLNADVEAVSSPDWKRFVAALPQDERTLLLVFTREAIHTPSRLQCTAEFTNCLFCQADNA